MANPTIAVIAAGAMGAPVGRRLADHGATVLTRLAGRTAATAARALESRMRDASDAEIAAADFILSIVPPSDAVALAERLAPALRAANAKPVYVDCNAVSPDTAKRIAAVVDATGCPFVDAGIIGGPPKPGYSPAFYASGPHASRFAALNDYGIDVRVLDGAVGAASALKMCYGGLTKGLNAIGSAMMLAATRHGAAEALYDEFAQSQPALLAWLSNAVPGMYAKAYRWDGEMAEVSQFLGADDPASDIYAGIARFYEEMAGDAGGDNALTGALTRFLARGNR